MRRDWASGILGAVTSVPAGCPSPSRRTSDREDRLARTQAEPGDVSEGGEPEVAVGVCRRVLGHDRVHGVDSSEPFGMGTRGPHQVEQRGRSRVASWIQRVAEAGHDAGVPEVLGDGRTRVVDAGLGHLVEEPMHRHARGAVQAARQHTEARADDRVRIGPRRCRHPCCQGRRRQLVVGQQRERRVEDADQLRRSRFGTESRPEAHSDGVGAGRFGADHHRRRHLVLLQRKGVDHGGDQPARRPHHRRGPQVVAE
jgi:hypothetical protein